MPKAATGQLPLTRQPLTSQQQQMVADNWKLAHKMASILWKEKWYQVRWLGDFDDVVSVGTMGLIRAVRYYNPKVARFSTLACLIIGQTIMTEARGAGVIRIPGSHDLDDPVVTQARRLTGLSFITEPIAPVERGQLYTSEELAKALAFLPSSWQRDLDGYYGLHGQTPLNTVQLAARQGVTKAAVQNRVARARREVRRHLEEMG